MELGCLGAERGGKVYDHEAAAGTRAPDGRLRVRLRQRYRLRELRDPQKSRVPRPESALLRPHDGTADASVRGALLLLRARVSYREARGGLALARRPDRESVVWG